VAWVSGLAAFGGLIVLAVAGVSSATAVLFTAVAIVGMIALGNILGGRTTPNRAPHAAPDRNHAPHGTGQESGSDERPGTSREERRGTMEP
jgi:predicted lipid-binding transport protein (Tim44 family)